MRHDQITQSLTQKSFDFFFWFSRFEAALKEKGLLKSKAEGDPALPCWESFVAKYASEYKLTDSGKRLIELSPERQVIGKGESLSWRPVNVDDCQSELCKVTRLLKTVRNNVFHGGKNGGKGWDQPDRTTELLDASIKELHVLASIADIKSELWQEY